MQALSLTSALDVRVIRSRHSLWFSVIALGLLVLAAPARAQWTRVAGIPATQLFSAWANGDTVAAGADTAIYVSTNAGASWRCSAKPVAGVAAIEAVWILNGRLYAGTFGQGVYVSDDLGETWSAFNEGLVGGFSDAQLDVVDFQVRGNDLYAATSGAGVFVRSLIGPSTWQPFGSAFEPNQAANVNSLALGGTRLLASAGSNGMVFIRDPADADWTISDLDNVGIQAGLQAQSAAWTGTGWVVGTSLGVFRSVAGQEPWTLWSPGLGPLLWTAFAIQGRHLFAAFDITNGAVIEDSSDDGATWQNAEVLPRVFVFDLVVSRNNLYAARADGLWRHSTGIASVPADGKPGKLRFALAGPQPFRDQTRLRFELPEAGTASIGVFDILGRAAGDRINGWQSSGPHEVTLDTRRLSPGVYTALLTVGGVHETVRLVHVR